MSLSVLDRTSHKHSLSSQQIIVLMGSPLDELLHFYLYTARREGGGPTLRRTQREKGRVMATMSQDIPNNSQPQTPIPPSEPGVSSGNMTERDNCLGSGSFLPDGSLLVAPFFMASLRYYRSPGYSHGVFSISYFIIFWKKNLFRKHFCRSDNFSLFTVIGSKIIYLKASLNLPFPHLITNCWMCFYEYLEIVLLILWKDKLFSVKKCVQDDYKTLGLPRPWINF